MNKDHDYIKELFDSDGIKAPESLSEDSMLAMLNTAEEKQSAGQNKSNNTETRQFETRRAKARPSLKKWVAVAAAAVIAVFGISGLMDIMTGPPDTSLAGDDLYTFKSEKEIERLLKSMDSSPRYGLIRLGRGASEDLVEYETEELADTDMADAGTTGAVSNSEMPKSAETGSYSETYLQVNDVDEADIVKTDGKYIYYVTDGREVVILSAKDGKTKKLSTVGSSGIENYINDIYVKGDRLITVGTIYKDDSDESSSAIVVYDISDRSKPEVLYDFSQSGDILSSRMVGDNVYLVTNYYVYRGGRIVPACGSIANPKKLDAADICCVPDPDTPSLIVISAVDVSSGDKGISTTKAVFGASSEIYCNDHNLYCTSTEYDRDSSTSYTRIVRASLDGLKVNVDATARVRGYVDSQFSMDERGGYFRIATTSERAGIEVNNLYVLDSKLKEAGKVTGFARNESIKSVRFIGDKAYVITYEAIDPLFIIDLSDPENPLIEGEVKIDGFSTLLIPVSKDRLLGIGHATGDNGYGGEYDSGLKLALFDISDPSEPKVLDSKEFKDMSSEAQYDHHALMVNSEAGYFAIPYEIWHYAETDGTDVIEDIEESSETSDTEDSETVILVDHPDEQEDIYDTGILLFKAGDKINSVDKHKLDSSAIRRSVYIGDWVYALDGDGNVKSFRPAF